MKQRISAFCSGCSALQKFLLGEIDRWGKVVRENNIRAD